MIGGLGEVADTATALRAGAPSGAVDAAFAECERIAREHYENFTLGSRLLPRPLRKHIAAIYAYARTADDFADEIPDPNRALAALDGWELGLRACYAGAPRGPIFTALAETIRTFRIPIDPFLNLLTAFRSDVDFTGFDTFDDLLGYCANSANPVGRLVLHLFEAADAERFARADDICTALQLTNFWQDVAVDWKKGRIYLPREDMRQFGYTADELSRGVVTPAFRDLMRFECERARTLFERGLPLADMLPRQRGREVRLFAWGGLAILDRLEEIGYDSFSARPTLTRWAKAGLVMRAFVGGAR